MTIKYIPEWEDPQSPNPTDAPRQRERQEYTAHITYDFMFDLSDLGQRLDPREAKSLPERVESIIQALNAIFNQTSRELSQLGRQCVIVTSEVLFSLIYVEPWRDLRVVAFSCFTPLRWLHSL